MQPTFTPYCGAAPSPDVWLGRWNLDPVLLTAFGLALAAWLLRPQALGGRAFGAALSILALTFISPLCALSSALFSARTAHHLLLTVAAAPLLAQAPMVKAAGGRLGAAAGVMLATATLWAWHAPRAYGWALSSDGAYWLMQASLLLTAALAWGAAMAARPTRPAAFAAAMLGLMVQMGLLGAVLTFAAEPFYAPHLAGPQLWGLTPLADQQAAGLIMWTLGALPYMAAALWGTSDVLKRLETPQGAV
jgi:putative membrane protein